MEYEKVDKVLLPMDRVKTLNPLVSKDKDVYFMNRLLYRSLFVLDKNLMAQEDLVESYSYDVENNTLKIKIKGGVKWSNGEALTEKDVKFSIEAYKKAAFANLSLYSNQVKNIGTVSVKEDTLLIKYLNKSEIALEDLTFPIVSMNQFKDIASSLKTSEKYIPVCSGPYYVDGFNPYSALIMKGNEHYAGIIPTNELIFKVIPAGSETINLIEPKLLTVAYSEKITRDVDFANLEAKISSYVSNELEWIGFNMNMPIMANNKIRKAVAMTIDMKEILESAYFGNGVLADSVYYPGYWGTEKGESIYPFDREGAEALLEKEGFKDLNKDGFLEDASGNKLTMRILVNGGDESRIAAAEILRSGLIKIKIDANISLLEGENYNAALASGNFDLYVGGAKMGENYDLRPLLKSFNGNPVGYRNPMIDKYLDALRTGISETEKVEIFKKIKHILADEIPYYPLVYKTYGVITSKDFNGEINPEFYDIYKGIETWSYNVEIQPEEEKTEN